jgi:hypothetical protein
MAEHPHTAPSTVSRRLFLTASGLTLAGATLAPLFGPRTALAHDEEDCSCLTGWAGIWAVAYAGGRYVALAGEIDTGTLEVHELTVHPDRQVELGTHNQVAFPEGFVPATLHGVGKRLLVGGAVVEEAERIRVDYAIRDSRLRESEYLIGYNPPHDGIADVSVETLRPALFEIDGPGMRELPIGDAAKQVRWGVVTSVTAVSDSGIALLIEGSTNYEEAYAERVVVAETVDDGAVWSADTVATGLGEGWPGNLVATGDDLVAITVDASERRTFFQRTARGATPWVAADVDGKGVVLGAVSGPDGLVVVLDSGPDGIRRQGYHPTMREWITPAFGVRIAGGPVHALLTIGGSPSEWIAIGQGSARIVTENA